MAMHSMKTSCRFRYLSPKDHKGSCNTPMRKWNIRSSPRFKSGKHFVYYGIISYFSTRHSLMGATNEVEFVFNKNEN